MPRQLLRTLLALSLLQEPPRTYAFKPVRGEHGHSQRRRRREVVGTGSTSSYLSPGALSASAHAFGVEPPSRASRMDAFELVRDEHGPPQWRRRKNSNVGVPPGVLPVFVAAGTTLAMQARRQDSARCWLRYTREYRSLVPCAVCWFLCFATFKRLAWCGTCVVWKG